MKKYIITVFILLVASGMLFAAAAEKGFAGTDTCLVCHDGVKAKIDKTPHRLDNAVQCENCHGPGQKHADDPTAENINGFRNVTAKKVLEVCSFCHTDRHIGLTSHYEVGEACLNCHDLWHTEEAGTKSPIPPRYLLKNQTADLCYTCHTQVRSDFMKPYHHQTSTFANRCVSCHDPHQTLREIRTRRIDSKCATCHPEMAGPFVYVHLGTDSRGCMECHVPHGGPNPNLLARHEARFLCLSCHTNVPQFHNQADPKYRQCTSCHAAIHGSNFNPKFME